MFFVIVTSSPFLLPLESLAFNVECLNACFLYKTYGNCLSVGFLVFEGDDVIVLAPNLADTDSDDLQASRMITIPDCSIKRVTDLSQSLAGIV